MIRGGAMVFFPCANFVFAPNQKQTSFASQARNKQIFFSYITPFCCQFCEQTFYFFQFAEQTIFQHFLLKNIFFKKPHSPPNTRIIWSAPIVAKNDFVGTNGFEVPCSNIWGVTSARPLNLTGCEGQTNWNVYSLLCLSPCDLGQAGWTIGRLWLGSRNQSPDPCITGINLTWCVSFKVRG